MQLKKFMFGTLTVLSMAGAQAQTVFSESFESVASLAGAGWLQTNLSVPTGSTSWFQGDAGVFAAQSGNPESYIAANFNNAGAGGFISNALVTPTFSTSVAGTISFWARGANDPGFVDRLSFGVTTDASASTYVLGAPVTLTGEWTQYTLNYSAAGAGSLARFAIVYFGLADISNYIGVDTLAVTAVPEPSAWLMFGGGALGLAALARRRWHTVR